MDFQIILTFDPLFDLYYFTFLLQWMDGLLLEIHCEVTSFSLKILDPLALITFYTDSGFSLDWYTHFHMS